MTSVFALVSHRHRTTRPGGRDGHPEIRRHHRAAGRMCCAGSCCDRFSGVPTVPSTPIVEPPCAHTKPRPAWQPGLVPTRRGPRSVVSGGDQNQPATNRLLGSLPLLRPNCNHRADQGRMVLRQPARPLALCEHVDQPSRHPGSAEAPNDISHLARHQHDERRRGHIQSSSEDTRTVDAMSVRDVRAAHPAVFAPRSSAVLVTHGLSAVR